MTTAVVAAALAAMVTAGPRERTEAATEALTPRAELARLDAGRSEPADEQERADRERERADQKADREEEAYDRGTEALDEERWDRALEAFDRVAAMAGHRADGALYWKAYAQRKAGRPTEAMATLAQLRKSAPQSKWLKEADALEQEIRQGA